MSDEYITAQRISRILVTNLLSGFICKFIIPLLSILTPYKPISGLFEPNHFDIAFSVYNNSLIDKASVYWNH